MEKGRVAPSLARERRGSIGASRRNHIGRMYPVGINRYELELIRHPNFSAWDVLELRSLRSRETATREPFNRLPVPLTFVVFDVRRRNFGC